MREPLSRTCRRLVDNQRSLNVNEPAARSTIKGYEEIMTGQAKTAIVTSITLHIIAFIVLMGVKLYYGEPDAQGEIPVAFVIIEKTKPQIGRAHV